MKSASDPIADITELPSTPQMRVAPFLCLMLAACSQNSDSIETKQVFRGLVDVGPHGPVFTSSEVLKGSAVEFMPWRMSGKELDAQAVKQALEGTTLHVEFLGQEMPVKPNGDGFDREVSVTDWISIRPCEASVHRLRECLDE